LTGGAGNDTLDGGAGNDTLDGGTGTDTASYGTATAGVTVSLAISGAQNTIGAGTDTLVSIENLTGSAYSDTLTGDGNANTIDGNGGADTIVGGAGNDSVILHGGETSVDGGAGTDTLILASATGVTVDLSNTADQTSGDSGTVTNFENVDAHAMTTAQSLTGSSGANTLIGGSGDDTIVGGGGADQLFGNAGNDSFTLDGSSLPVGIGSHVDGGAGTDTLTIAANTSSSFSGADLAAALTNVEIIDFRQAGVNANLSLSGAQVAAMTDSNHDLTINTSLAGGDTISIADAASRYTMSSLGNVTSYDIYADDAHAQLLAHLHISAA
jgi:Ca2+-binding RTX toxin-like protein